MLALERITGPDIEPVTLAEFRRHVREYNDVTANDADYASLITGGREWVEDYTGRVLIEQTWKLTIGEDAYCLGDTVRGNAPFATNYWQQAWQIWLRRREIMLHKAPAIAIVSFKAVDQLGVETDVDAATYEIREPASKWPRIVPLSGATWGIGLYRVTFRAGFADRTGSPQQGAEVVPERFKQAIKLWAEANYDRDPKMMPLLLQTAESLIRAECSNLQLA